MKVEIKTATANDDTETNQLNNAQLKDSGIFDSIVTIFEPDTALFGFNGLLQLAVVGFAGAVAGNLAQERELLDFGG